MKYIISVIALSVLIGIILIIVEFIFPNNTFFIGFGVIGICILLGIAVKTMDQLIDEIKSKSYLMLIIPLAVFIPTAMAFLALTEEPVVGMVIGTVIGLLIAGKLDHPMYIVSVILFVVFISAAYLLQIINLEVNTFYIIPVALIGSFIDEYGHTKCNYNKKIVKFVFKHRFFLKIFAFFGFLLNFAQLVHLIGFLSFDIFYDILETVRQYEIGRSDG